MLHAKFAQIIFDSEKPLRSYRIIALYCAISEPFYVTFDLSKDKEYIDVKIVK